MSEFSPENPNDLLGALPTYVNIVDKKDGSRKPILVEVYDDVAVYYEGRHKNRKRALDAAEKAILKVAEAKGV